jgi:asparagine synthase (glutamine-hydrolysing)
LLRELNGMFAVAIYDTEKNELTISRDFAGIKPLFYGIGRDSFVFASQFDQVFKHPAFRGSRRINSNGLRDYFELGYMQAPNTVFDKIFQVKPGYAVVVDSDLNCTDIEICTFSPNVKSFEYKETTRATTDEFSRLFSEVVADQLASDVPIGAFLSGGIDSPLVTAVAKKYNTGIKAFTFNVNDPALSELAKATEYSKHINAELIVESLEASTIIDECNEHFAAYPEPFGDPSSLPTFIITKLARRHLTVLLSGDGGDEVFWGYPRFLGVLDHAEYFKYPRTSRRIVSGIQRKLGKKVSYGASTFSTIGEWQLQKHSHLSSDFVSRLFETVPRTTFATDLYQFSGTEKPEILSWLRWNEFYAHMQRILIKVDRASMYNSIEVRVPFLDKRILDFAWKVEPSLGIEHREPKFILKRAMEQHYPKEMINKVKQGFAMPYESYLRNELKSDVAAHLLEGQLFGGEHYNVPMLRKYVENYLKTGQGNGWGVWIVYAMQKWAARYSFV